MRIRLLDEVIPLGNKGILLFVDNGETGICPGSHLQDAHGATHLITKVDVQEDWLALFIEKGDSEYFERLFRDIRVDATAFELLLPEN